MADQVPVSEASAFEWVLRWWAVIVAVLTLGYTVTMRLVVFPRAELRRLSSEVQDLREDIAALVAMRDRQIGDLERSVEKMRDTIWALHAIPGQHLTFDMLTPKRDDPPPKQ